mgnify:CR=1 FL=1
MKSKSQVVYDYIENLVISGEKKPGERLPSESKLGEILNVSRVSVRAGIEKLSAIGLVSKRKGGGSYVNYPSENYLRVFTPTILHNTDFHELLDIRRSLDTLSVELAAKVITDDELKVLKAIVEEMSDYEDANSFFELDRKFHLAISKYSKNRFLLNIQTMIWDVIKESQRLSYDTVANRNRLIEHQMILEALEAHDVDLARSHILSHLEKIIDTYQNDPKTAIDIKQ